MVSLIYISDYLYVISILIIAILIGITESNKPNICYRLNILMSQGVVNYIIIKYINNNWINEQNYYAYKIICIVAMLLVIYFILVGQETYNENIPYFEFPILILLAFFGMMIMIESTDLLIIFLALELQAFVYYTLVGLKQKSLLASEGSLKYFLIGSLASSIFILGTSYIYGFTALTDLLTITDVLLNKNSDMGLRLGGILLVIAILFKIGAVPFHFWLPDAYQGASFHVFFFLIIFPKIFLFYLLYSINLIFNENLIIFLALLLSAIVGSIQALHQFKVQRFLAYTIIYNNAFFLSLILIPSYFALLSLLSALILYIFGSFLTLCIFFSIRNQETNLNFTALRDLISLRKSNLFLAIPLIISFFSSAGMPPFIGFFQKFFIFETLLEQSHYFLVIILILSSILPAYYYIRVSKIIFFMSNSKWLLLKSINVFSAKILSFFFLFTLYFLLNPSLLIYIIN